MKKNQSLAIKLALLTVLLWSTVATAFKLALEGFTPAQLVVVASLVSLITLLLIYWQQSKREQPKLIESFKRRPLMYLLAGTINPVIYYLVLFAAYDELPAQIAQPINYTWAIVLSLLAVPVLKQSFHKGDAVGLIFSYIGVFILVTKFEFSGMSDLSYVGVLLAILSTLLWASYWLINTKLSAPPIQSLLICFICALPSLAILAWFSFDEFNLTATSLFAAVYIGLFEMSLAFVFWLMAMKAATSTAQISSLIYLSPFLSLVFIYFIVGEPIYPTTLLALIIIVIGLVLQKKLNKEVVRG